MIDDYLNNKIPIVCSNCNYKYIIPNFQKTNIFTHDQYCSCKKTFLNLNKYSDSNNKYKILFDYYIKIVVNNISLTLKYNIVENKLFILMNHPQYIYFNPINKKTSTIATKIRNYLNTK